MHRQRTNRWFKAAQEKNRIYIYIYIHPHSPERALHSKNRKTYSWLKCTKEQAGRERKQPMKAVGKQMHSLLLKWLPSYSEPCKAKEEAEAGKWWEQGYSFNYSRANGEPWLEEARGNADNSDIWQITLENCLAVPFKVNHTSTLWPNNFILRFFYSS